tara:strand:+ start:2936 stop:3046 length:111 start_codon:yes stop_codon:yes gene_type:complete
MDYIIGFIFGYFLKEIIVILKELSKDNHSNEWEWDK